MPFIGKSQKPLTLGAMPGRAHPGLSGVIRKYLHEQAGTFFDLKWDNTIGTALFDLFLEVKNKEIDEKADNNKLHSFSCFLSTFLSIFFFHFEEKDKKRSTCRIIYYVARKSTQQ